MPPRALLLSNPPAPVPPSGLRPAPRCSQPRPPPTRPAGLQRRGPRSRPGSSLASHPAPPRPASAAPGLSLRPASPSPSHLRPAPPSPRVAIFSESSARRHRLSSQLTVRSRALPPSELQPRRGVRGRGASRTPRSAHGPGPRSRRARPRLLLRRPARPPTPRRRSRDRPRVNFRSPLGVCLGHSLLERWLFGDGGEVRGSPRGAKEGATASAGAGGGEWHRSPVPGSRAGEALRSGGRASSGCAAAFPARAGLPRFAASRAGPRRCLPGIWPPRDWGVPGKPWSEVRCQVLFACRP